LLMNKLGKINFQQGVAEGLTEMDKSQPSAGRDTGPRSGPDRYVKPITSKQMQDRALDKLNRAVKDSHKKKDVKEATDSATSNLIWKAMNYLPHDRPKDMEDILVQIAHNQGPVTRVTDDPEKLASLVQAVWMDGQTRKQKAGQQLDELSKDTLKNYMRAQPARIKGPTGLATTNSKKAARIVDPEKGDMRRALTNLKDPEYGQQTPRLPEDSLNEFARGEGGYGPFKIYIGHDFTDKQFSTFKAARDAIELLQNNDPATADSDWRIVNGTGRTVWEHVPASASDDLAENSLSAMRRLAGIVPQVPLVVPNGQRQYRHMPTAVQPR